MRHCTNSAVQVSLNSLRTRATEINFLYMFNINLFDRLKKTWGWRLLPRRNVEKRQGVQKCSSSHEGEGMGAKLGAKPFSLPSVMSRKISRRLANIRNVLYIVWRSIIQVLRVKRLRARDISFVDKKRVSLHLNQLFYSAKTHLVFCCMKGLGVW